jgi:hypothetical protein
MILALGDRDPGYLTHREIDAARDGADRVVSRLA